MPLLVGVCGLGERHLLGDAYSDEDRVEFGIYSFLLRRVGWPGVMLVDLGPKTVGFLNGMFRRYGFFRGDPEDGSPGPDDIRQPAGNVLDQLAEIGVDRRDVTTVLLTHLHADHHGMDTPDLVGLAEDLPGAVFHVSSVGWSNNVRNRRDGKWASYVDHRFSDFLEERMGVQRAYAHDNTQIAPGVRTLYLGGHSVCSQAVAVETAAGTAVITSDEVYRYDLLARGTLARLHVTPARWRVAVERLARMAVDDGAILLPVHDPALAAFYERSGSSWLDDARTASDESARGYLAAVATMGRR